MQHLISVAHGAPTHESTRLCQHDSWQMLNPPHSQHLHHSPLERPCLGVAPVDDPVCDTLNYIYIYVYIYIYIYMYRYVYQIVMLLHRHCCHCQSSWPSWAGPDAPTKRCRPSQAAAWMGQGTNTFDAFSRRQVCASAQPSAYSSTVISANC